MGVSPIMRVPVIRQNLVRGGRGISGPAGKKLIWLLYDEFTTADAAPITSPRTCEPGPGVLTKTLDTDGNASIGGGVFKLDQVSGDARPNYWWEPDSQLDLRVGLSFGAWIKNTVATTQWLEVGLGSGIGVRQNPFVYAGSYKLADDSGYIIFDALALNEERLINFIRRSVGFHFVVDGKLWWVDTTEPTNTTDRAIIVRSVYDGATWSSETDKHSIIDLLANGYSEWDADFSTVTDLETNPAHGAAFNHTADFHLRCTYTAEAGKYLSLYTRYEGATDYSFMVQDATGTLKGWERDPSAGINALFALGGLVADTVEYQWDIIVEGNAGYFYLDNVLKWSGTLQYNLTGVTTGRVETNLATNDIVLSTHPYPALGIATDRWIAPQTAETNAAIGSDGLIYFRDVTLDAALTRHFLYRGTDYTGAPYCSSVEFYADGSIKVYEYGAPPSTLITAGAATVSDGDDIALIYDGTYVELFVNGTSVGSSNSAGLLTNTGALLLNALSVGSIELFPRDVSGLLHPDLV